MKDISIISKKPETYVLHLPNLSEDIFFQVCIPFGTVHEGVKLRGQAHVLEHYILGVMNLHARYTNPNIHINGSVSLFYTKFYLTTRVKTAWEDIKLFLDYIYKPNFTHHGVLRYESKSIINELQESCYSLESEMGNYIEKSLYNKDNPYYAPDKLTLYNTSRITLHTLEQEYLSHLRSTRPTICIGGSNLSQEIISKIYSLIKNYPIGTNRVTNPPYTAQRGIQKSFSISHIIAGNYVFAGFPTYSDSVPIVRRIALGVLCDILGGKTEFGLFRAMREQGIYSFSAKRRHLPNQGLLMFRSFVDDDQLPQAFYLLYQKVKHLQNTPIQQDIIDEQIRRRKEHFENVWRSNGDKFDWLIDDILFEHTFYNLHSYEKILKSITSKLLHEIVHENFSWDEMSLFVFSHRKVSLKFLSGLK